MADGDWDYVIVGAGSAGCVLANRLTADKRTRVLVLEAGGSDRHPYIWAPAGFLKTFADPRFNWCFTTEAGDAIGGRQIHFPRGKVLGGSSAINGHLYVRGQAADFDAWAQMGNRGWSYEDVLPYFRKSEDRATGADDFHGTGGPQHVSDIHSRHPICEAFIEGAASVGLPTRHDYNGASQEGVTYYQRTIKHGRRASAATSFLRPALARQNLQIVTHAMVQRVEMQGTHVCGLTYKRGDQMHTVRPKREVILAAGAIGSPHLLQISGIGEPKHLSKIGVQIRHALAGVGAGLQDHYAARVVNRVTRPITLNERARAPRLWWEILKWATAGKGLIAFSPAHVGGFVRSRPELDLPDLQLVFTPASYSDGVTGALHKMPGMTAGFWQMRPESKGHVRARNANPSDPPVIQPNYLAAEVDQQVALAGFHWCRSLLESPQLAPYRAFETSPGPECTDDAQILDHIRATGTTVYHAIGTCRMGQDPNAVVDDRLRIHGLHGVRVIDASIMPTMPSANTNAATLMIAERASDFLKSDG